MVFLRMTFLFRCAICAWISITLVSCQTAGSTANSLMSTFGTAGRMVDAMARSAGLSASVSDPDTDSNSVAERGKLIESQGDFKAPEAPQGSQVAQR